MADLNDLKQQLYQKIKERQQPETTPNQTDLLKYSDLRANQQFESWKQSPTQRERINLCPPGAEVGNKPHLSIIQDKLLEVVENLTFSHHYLESTGLSKRYTALFTAICDALTTTSEAVERCGDQPDE
jgi:hypothetical protein